MGIREKSRVCGLLMTSLGSPRVVCCPSTFLAVPNNVNPSRAACGAGLLVTMQRMRSAKLSQPRRCRCKHSLDKEWRRKPGVLRVIELEGLCPQMCL